MHKINGDNRCSQTQFKAVEADAEMLRVVLRKELGGATLAALGAAKQMLDSIFSFCLFKSKWKSSPDFFC